MQIRLPSKINTTTITIIRGVLVTYQIFRWAHCAHCIIEGIKAGLNVGAGGGVVNDNLVGGARNMKWGLLYTSIRPLMKKQKERSQWYYFIKCFEMLPVFVLHWISSETVIVSLLLFIFCVKSVVCVGVGKIQRCILREYDKWCVQSHHCQCVTAVF